MCSCSSRACWHAQRPQKTYSSIVRGAQGAIMRMLTRLHLEREFELEHDACPGKDGNLAQSPLLTGVGAPTGKTRPVSPGTVHKKLSEAEVT